MTLFKLAQKYIVWHYSRALVDLWGILMNIEWFLFNFFSINVLFKTLFARWRRLGERRTRGFNIADFFATLLINTMMRIVGFFMRSLMIIMGIIAMAGTFLIGVFSCVAWFALPVIIVSLAVVGVDLLLFS